ncbi:MAG: DUF4276 family protein [Deltaproteobacteria bacterium]|jgi:hypothetical protein|nr:DUF4276 family protein [Deltaproteobacteria bacterium]
MKRELVFLVEGRAEEALINALAPRLLPPGHDVKVLTFRGKQDLEKSLPRTLKVWRNPQASFLILRDQDSGDCLKIKAHLLNLVEGNPADCRPYKIRVACRALESWYLAQLAVVEAVFNQNALARQQNCAKFRNPDQLANPDMELGKLTGGMYQKVDGSERLGRALSLDDSRSPSFKNFIVAIKHLAEIQ